MIELFVYQRAYKEGYQSISDSQQIELKRWYCIVDNYYTEIFNIYVYGVTKEYLLYPKIKGIYRVEYCRHIHKKHSKYAPKIFHITEENEER